jgi:hypothetical protein
MVETSGKYEDDDIDSSGLERRNDIDLRSVCHDFGRSESIVDSIKPSPALGSTSVLKGK